MGVRGAGPGPDETPEGDAGLPDAESEHGENARVAPTKSGTDMATGNGRDVVVVGGGVVGLGVARDAALRGLSVVVVERGMPGRGASWAAAGMLSPISEAAPGNTPFLEIGLQSLRLWREWVAGVEEASGVDVGYHECGKLRVALSTPEAEMLGERYEHARSHGLDVRWLDPEAIRTEEPSVSPGALGGLRIGDDYTVDNRGLADALLGAARRAGVEVRVGTEAVAVEVDGGSVAGVRLADGGRLPAGRVVVAAGAWAGALSGLPHPLPVRPVKGQMLALRPDGPLFRGMLESEDVYLVPRSDGRILVGATVEESGFETEVTAEGVRGLLAGAIRLAPALGRARLAETWAGLRPGTPDGLPILGPDPATSGLFHATGHFRNGILLAPFTAQAIGALVCGESGPSIPDAYRPDRFGRGS